MADYKLTYPRKWKWPDGERIAMTIGMAFESFKYASQYSHFPESGKVDHFSLSYSDYGWKAGVWRLLDLLNSTGLKSNVSTNGLAAKDHPDAVKAITDAGHEVNGHGWVNDIIMKDDEPEAEREDIRAVTEAIVNACGVRPVGWTSPGSTGTKNTLNFLREAGYIWIGDDASDDLPFLRATPHGPIVVL